MHQLDGDHGAAAPNVPDAVVLGLHAVQSGEHDPLDLPGTRHEIVGLESSPSPREPRRKRRDCRRTSHRDPLRGAHP